MTTAVSTSQLVISQPLRHERNHNGRLLCRLCGMWQDGGVVVSSRTARTLICYGCLDELALVDVPDAGRGGRR